MVGIYLRVHREASMVAIYLRVYIPGIMVGIPLPVYVPGYHGGYTSPCVCTTLHHPGYTSLLHHAVTGLHHGYTEPSSAGGGSPGLKPENNKVKEEK